MNGQVNFDVIAVFSFDELPQKVQEKIIENKRIERSAVVDYDFDISSFKRDALKKGFIIDDDRQISFTGFSSQGDGASFTTDVIDFEQIIKNSSLMNDFPELKNKENLSYIVEGLCGEIRRIDHYYAHKNTVSAYVDYSSSSPEDPLMYKLDSIGEALVPRLEKILEDLKDDLCTKLYSDLEATYDADMSEDNIIEYLRDDDTLYTCSGIPIDDITNDTILSREAIHAKLFLKLPASQQKQVCEMIDGLVKQSNLSSSFSQ